jgi:class 3 adenylate cyclase
MSEVRKWLDSIGLAQYGDAFETNDLDIDLLGQVDDQLLKDVGVLSAGHRLRIRNAIAKLGAHVQSESNDRAPVAAGAAIAERRQVTVMFSDLVGSTALQRAWTLKTSAKSFPPIRSASRRPFSASAAS